MPNDLSWMKDILPNLLNWIIAHPQAAIVVGLFILGALTIVYRGRKNR